jgi:hypothetical protein
MDFVKRIVWFSLLACGIAYAQVTPVIPTNNIMGNSSASPAAPSAIPMATFYPETPITNTFNILHYGAKCDGFTDDSAAINSTIAAAKASSLYTSPYYGEVIVTGPSDSAHLPCLVGSSGSTYGINATGIGNWNALGNGLSANRMVFRNLNIVCSDPSSFGIVCFDASNSLNIDIENTVNIKGDSTKPPLIGMAIGNYVAGNPCCIQYHREQIFGSFIFANLYDMASETTSFYGIMYSNGYTARGSIDLLGTLTGGSGYDGGGSATFSCIPLTGGSGTGATATVTVTAGVVTKVVPCLGGYGYVTSDNLSATVANLGNSGGSGFTQGLTSIVNWTVVLDGQAHWLGILPNGGSHWYTATAVADTQYSFTQTNFYGGSIRSNLSSLWMAATTSPHFYHTYLNAESNTAARPCVYLYDNGVAQNIAPYFDIRCESNRAGGVGDFYITGTNTSPQLETFTIKIDYESNNLVTSPSMFNIDPAIQASIGNGSIGINNTDIAWASAKKLPMFGLNAYQYTVTGKISTWVPYTFNMPYTFSGQLCLGEYTNSQYTSLCSQANTFTPIDQVLPNGGANIVAFAGSCARVLLASYKGPLCQVERTSDSTSMDIYPDAYGNMDRGSFSAFCTNTTCQVKILYDQSFHGNGAIQNTTASQPVLNLADSTLGNRSSMTFVTAGAQSLVVTAAIGVNDIFATAGGSVSVVISRAATGATLGRIAYKTDGSTVGWELRTNGTTNPKLELLQQASVSALDYATTGTIGAALPNVLDVEYTNTSSANAPAMAISGTTQTFSTSTAYTGTVSSDSAQNLIIGNNAATGGTNAFSGNIAEIILFSPTNALNAIQLEALRRNQANYYNISTPVIH